MIRVAALTSGLRVPSSRFRVRQHIAPLKQVGIEVAEYVPRIDKYGNLPYWPEEVDYRYGLPLFLVWQGLKVATRLPGVVGSWNRDMTWLERHLVPGLLTLEPLLGKPLIFDVDDAIWLAPPFRRSAWKIAARSSVVVAGNRYIAERFSPYARNLRVVPTAIDTGRYRPRQGPPASGSGLFTVGWIGTSGNLRYLQALEDPLRRFLSDHADARILVVADKPPCFPSIPEARVRFLPWTEEGEVAALQQMDVGLMPLPDEEWTRGKCSFKMLQYLACALPVAVSPVGMNAEVLEMGPVGVPCTSPEEWYEALAFFRSDREKAAEFGNSGRGIVEQHFSRERITGEIASIFRSLA